MAEHTVTRVIRWIVIGALFIIPFISIIPGITISDAFFFPFITGKNFTFRILVEIAFGGWAFLALADKRYRPKFSWIAVIFGVFVVWMAVADAFAVNPEKAFWSNYERMDGWVTLAHLFMFFCALTTLTVTKLWRRWWMAFVAAATVLCGWSILQILHVLPIHQGSTRVDASIGNSAYLAALLLFSFAMTLWLAFESKGKKWLEYMLYALGALQVIILFFTETRGAILGFVGAVILGAFLWMMSAGGRGRKAAAGILVTAFVLIGGFMLVRTAPWIQNIPALGRLASISLSDGETTARFHIWHMAYEGFLERPITGWGQEGFNYVFNKYYTPNLFAQEQWFDRAHDVFFDWLVAGGAPAFVLFVALLGVTVYSLWKAPIRRDERILLISALAAYAFQGLFVFDNLFTYMPLVAILAMAHIASAKPLPLFEKWGEVKGDQLTIVALPVTAVAIVLVIWFVNVPGMRGASDLITAITPTSDGQQNLAAFKQAYADGSFANQEITEQLMGFASTAVTSSSISMDTKQAIANYAVQQMEALIKQIPQDARVRIEYAYGLRSFGQYEAALAQVKIAEQLSPNKQSILIEEGVEELQAKDYADANAAFQKAYSLDTSFSSLAQYAAVGKMVTNDVAGGKALLQQAYGTTTVDADVVLLGYYTAGDYPDFIATWLKRAADQNYSADAEFGLAAAYANAKQFALARSWIERAVQDHPEYTTEGTQFLQEINTMAGK